MRLYNNYNSHVKLWIKNMSDEDFLKFIIQKESKCNCSSHNYGFGNQ